MDNGDLIPLLEQLRELLVDVTFVVPASEPPLDDVNQQILVIDHALEQLQ